MSNYYIHRGSFIAPVKRKCEDGRRLAATVIRKMYRGEPLSPAMQKRTAPAERSSAFGAEADETLQEIKKVHATGRRPGLPRHTAQGDEVVGSKSVSMVKRARAHGIHVTDRMLGARELNKAFAGQAGKRDVAIDAGGMRKGANLSSDQWNHMSWQERRDHFQKLGSARPRVNDRNVTDDYNRGAPESSNGQWNDVHHDTGATNDWHDEIAPTTKPTRVTFHQCGTPGRSSRDDAIEAIRQDLTKPKRMGASPNTDDSFARER
jgi:hypothetical protein